MRISAQKTLARNSPEYAKFKQHAGLAESNFSLAQLFIDSSSSTKWNYDLSDFGDRQSDWNSLGSVAVGQFQSFIQGWLNSEATQNNNILADDSRFNEYAPSFPPTSITYHNYPWRDPSFRNSRQTDNNDKNAISYLMVGGFRDPPTQIGLPYSGTFVEENGLYCMSRTIFWESWLHKQLVKVIRMMAIVPDEPGVSYNPNDPHYPWGTVVRLHVGDDSSLDSQYFLTHTAGSSAWFYTGPERYTEGFADGNGDKGKGTETANNSGMIRFDKGGGAVTVSGTGFFDLYVAHGPNYNRWTKVRIESNWSLTIGMAAIEDGGLEFKVVPKSDTVNTFEVCHAGPLNWKNGIGSTIKHTQTVLKEGLQYGYSKVETNLLNALATQEKLFLPAAGTFLMKDPKFNKRGDLIVNLEFNGAESPPHRHKRRLPHHPPIEPPAPIRIDLNVSDKRVREVSDASENETNMTE